MSEQTPPPTLVADRVEKDRHTGRLLIGSGLINFVLVLVVVVLATVVMQQSGAITRLSDALSGQREQFTDCKGKPATATGCTQPVAAEPSVIVKHGAQGLQGLAGKDGRDGIDGKDGRDGITPPCMRTPRQCQGADGKPAPTPPPGADGKDGKDGADGKDGLTPPCYFEPNQCQGADGKDGPQGEMGVQGPRGVSINSSQCVDDDTPDGSHWLITYSDGTQETAKGPCRVKLP